MYLWFNDKQIVQRQLVAHQHAIVWEISLQLFVGVLFEVVVAEGEAEVVWVDEATEILVLR